MSVMSADVERMDSLDGWVAIKSDIFEDRETHNIRFLVRWSEAESKFAVICHNRTLQQRRRRRRMRMRMKVEDEEEDEDEDEEECSWAAMFSASELKHIHQQLSGSGDALCGFLPELRAFTQAGVWDTLLRRSWQEQEQERERDVEAVCVQLERYFSTAVDVCGVKILLETLFPQEEEGEEDKYCENLQEFKRRAMEEQVRRAKHTLDTIIQSHRAAAGLVQLMKIYEDEDEAYGDLVTIATQFYQHQLQPFRDMRELSTLHTMEIQKMLQLQELGPKRVCELEKEAEEWSRGVNEAVCSIQDVTVCYFTETTTALSAPPLPLSDKETTGIPTAGSMDDVLASLQRGRVHLRKVTPNPQGASTETGNFRDSLLSAIRQGVTLKKTPPPTGPARCHDSELELSIKAAMMRMKKVSNESDDEERPDTPPGEWDS
ncbi:hypothetical protein PDJAM_G00218100 [Pangasius djambal]|uniref:Uncharacterized protein n=1 Tax=Pangasius djambal TaxID=1691987 RepID=A0ACC5YDF6_9TELE|nr:hypothetical protein [Pangasius djambal]